MLFSEPGGILRRGFQLSVSPCCDCGCDERRGYSTWQRCKAFQKTLYRVTAMVHLTPCHWWQRERLCRECAQTWLLPEVCTISPVSTTHVCVRGHISALSIWLRTLVPMSLSKLLANVLVLSAYWQATGNIFQKFIISCVKKCTLICQAHLKFPSFP